MFRETKDVSKEVPGNYLRPLKDNETFDATNFNDFYSSFGYLPANEIIERKSM